MKNCLIFGSGRSGTSMLGGMLHDAGYYMGENLYPARDSNPKGFFENDFINGINERILKKYDKKKQIIRRYLTGKTSVHWPGKGQHWLSSIPEEIDISTDNRSITRDIKTACKQDSFAYKDPRFSYTLPVWERYLPKNTVYVVIFRDPAIVVNSTLKECSAVEYLKNMVISKSDVYDSWFNIYSHVLKNSKSSTHKYLFVNYDQIIKGEGVQWLAEFLSAEINSDFVDSALMRTQSTTSAPERVHKLFRELNQLSMSGL